MHEVVPRPSDTVVEAGTYWGKDTALFAKLSDQVVSFEPSPRNYSIAEKKLKRFKNVKLINEGLWNEGDQIEIQYANNPNDDGFLEDEAAASKDGDTIPVNTIRHYTDQLGIDSIDFLKVEAEGAEPEVIEGLGDLRPRDIVVNTGEERDGEPTGRQVMELLQPMGYTLVGMKHGRTLFLTQQETASDTFQGEFVDIDE
jgi:FkbM family methyltransferase